MNDKLIAAHRTDDPNKLPFNQDTVDLTRLRITEELYNNVNRARKKARQLIIGDYSLEEKVKKLMQPHHVWFPKPTIGKRELRKGKAPPDRDRPEHLRGLVLDIDIVKFLRMFAEGRFPIHKLNCGDLGVLVREFIKLLPGKDG